MDSEVRMCPKHYRVLEPDLSRCGIGCPEDGCSTFISDEALYHWSRSHKIS